MTQAILLLLSAIIGYLAFSVLFPDTPLMRVIGTVIGAVAFLACFAWNGRRKS